jgi:hypothetical protein
MPQDPEIERLIDKLKAKGIEFTDEAIKLFLQDKQMVNLAQRVTKAELIKKLQERFLIHKDKKKVVVKPKPGQLTIAPTIDKLPLQIMDEKVITQVFEPQEIARLKLLVFTSVNVNEKIEALRKLYFAPIKIEDKFFIYLKAITDPSAEVRKEAAIGLKYLGLNKDLCGEIETVSVGTPVQKHLSLQKLRVLQKNLSSAENDFALAFLVSQLKYEKQPELMRDIIQTLSEFSEAIAKNPEIFSMLNDIVIKIASEHFYLVYQSVSLLYDKISKYPKEELARILWKEIPTIQDIRLRPFFLSTLAQFAIPSELKDQICEDISKTVASAQEDNIEVRRLAETSKLLGDKLIYTMLEKFQDVKKDNKPFYLSILDEISVAENISDKAREEVGRFYVQLFREESRDVKRALLENRLCYYQGLNPNVKKEISRELISSLHLQEGHYLFDLTIALLTKMGNDVLEPLAEAISTSPYMVERKTAGEIITEIISQQKTDGNITKFLKFFQNLEDGTAIPAGDAVKMVGRICSNQNIKKEEVEKIYKDYRTRLGRVSYNFQLIDALGWIITNKNISPAFTVDTTLMFLSLLEGQFPDLKVEEKKTPEGVRLVFDPLSEMYTELIPILLDALRRSFSFGRLPEKIQDNIIQRLITKWKKLVNYEEIWSPNNVIVLAEVLGEIAKAKQTKLKNKTTIIKTLCFDLNNTSIIKILSDVCWNRGYDDSEYSQTIIKIVKHLLKILDTRYFREPEDIRVVITALGKFALNKILAPTQKETEAIKLRITEILIENYSLEYRTPKKLLEKLAESEDISPELKTRILSALKRM